MRNSKLKRSTGFTLVEVLIGMTLSLMVMGAVLSGYVFLGRNFSRSLGLTSANQPTLESQGRRSLALFTADVRMASGLDLSGTAPNVIPSSSGVTLIVPSPSGPKKITYYFNKGPAPVLLDTFQIPLGSLARIDQQAGAIQILHTNLLALYFRYFDASGHPYDNNFVPYVTGSNYLSSIKQISVTFTSQAGSASNGTLTQVYSNASPLLILSNKALPQ